MTLWFLNLYKQIIKKKYLNKNINTITSDKNKKLKKWIYVKYTNLNLKRCERMLVRKDRKLNIFMGWIYSLFVK